MKITILGARGSIPTDGKDMSQFGGATSCVLAETDDLALFLDAGTGITSIPDIGARKIAILITHPHIDHVLGLPFCTCLAEEGRKIDFYATVKYGLGVEQQISRMLSEPLWPCTINDYPADIACHDITSFPFEINKVEISGMESNHPGGCTIFKIMHGGKSFVYATDYEHSEEKDAELIDFCRGTDLLLYDGQYTEEEYDIKKGYGHSTPKHAVMIMQKSGAKMMRILHHDPGHNDEMLLKMEEEIKTDTIAFARQGEEIWLQR